MSTINPQLSFKDLTSFGVGGPGQELTFCESSEQLETALNSTDAMPWILGFGSNVVVSDEGLPGLSLIINGGDIEQRDDLFIADSGVWWDDLVVKSIEAGYWGLELTSGIPGSVGAGVVGNIAAYGQSVADTLAWVEIYDFATKKSWQRNANELELTYRSSNIQQNNMVILRAAFRLHKTPQKPLEYASALSVAKEMQQDVSTLHGRRISIIESRKRAHSLYDPKNDIYNKTAGSFFKNPIVSESIAEKLVAFDESNKSTHEIKKQNLVHGGNTQRVSAAHVLLAAGFHRGQNWGDVGLNQSHILKIENLGNAKAQDIFDVVHQIQETVTEKLGIELETEVKFLGQFSGKLYGR